MGRKIDNLVATTVMELRRNDECRLWVNDRTGRKYFDNYLGDGLYDSSLPHYSTDVSAAWQVVRKVNLLNGRVMHRVYNTDLQKWEWHISSINENSCIKHYVTADTECLVICKAALKLHGIDITDEEAM